MTTLTYRMAAALAAGWGQGDEVVVSRLDHDANVRPWLQAAARVGAVVRWAEVDLATGELPAGQYDGLVTERTRLVAVSAASNVLGTRPDVAAICATAHAAGALTYVDGVHAAAHGPVDAAALGADFYATSAYKWSGPHVGAVVADPALLERLRPDKLASSPDRVPERFEQGTSPFADFAGVAPPSTTWPPSTRPPPAAAASGCWPRWPRPRRTSWSCSGCWWAGWRPWGT
jgi:selenocysteine lyase/cysteine desulfurase